MIKAKQIKFDMDPGFPGPLGRFSITQDGKLKRLRPGSSHIVFSYTESQMSSSARLKSAVYSRRQGSYHRLMFSSLLWDLTGLYRRRKRPTSNSAAVNFLFGTIHQFLQMLDATPRNIKLINQVNFFAFVFGISGTESDVALERVSLLAFVFTWIVLNGSDLVGWGGRPERETSQQDSGHHRTVESWNARPHGIRRNNI